MSSSERVFVIKTEDSDFDPVDLLRKLGCKSSAQELTKGIHTVFVGEKTSRVHEPWISPDKMPVTTVGRHALFQIIMHLTADMFDLKMEHLCGKSRLANVMEARRIAAYLCCDAVRGKKKHSSSRSLVSTKDQRCIAANFNRHRSDIYHLDKWVHERLDMEPELAAMVSALKPKIISKLPIDEQDLKERFGEVRVCGG